MTLGAMMIPAVSGGPWFPWADGTFANTSSFDRHLWAAAAKKLYGGYAAGVPGIAIIGGERRLQMEGLRPNNIPGDLSTYTLRGTTVRTASQPDPTGGTGAFKLEALNTGSNDLFNNYSSVTSNAVVAASLFIKRISTTGFVFYKNGQDAGRGNWNINLALLGDGWERITAQHPAVTVVAAFQNTAAGKMGSHIGVASGGPCDIYVWQPQQVEGAFPSSPIPEASTRNADSMSFASGQVPASFRSGTWSCEATLQFTGGDLANSDQHMLFYNDTSNFLCVEKTAGGVYQVRMATSSGDLTRTVTNSRDDTVIITPDYAGGNLTVANFTTGDGTASGTVSDLPVSTLHVGTNGANEKHAYMLLAEPRLAA